MDVRVRLVHADGNQRVVLAEAYEGDRPVASALGEASGAEEAEERARGRLLQLLQQTAIPRPVVAPNESRPEAAPPASSTPAIPQPSPSPSPPLPPEEPVATAEDPEDWSADLAQLDRLVRQLGWGKEEERVFLQRLFGHPNRSRLTHYGDLLLFRRALEALSPGAQPSSAPLPMKRTDLLSQCDGLLQRLGWSTDQARKVLEQHFAASSRQHLSDEQLLAFNLLLEGELLPPMEPVAGQPLA
ncbi:MAG: hypothetical protein VKO19_09090 [Cyanobacteriota bacterium]|nr:hypothetical protein [Cyanobacteriota bacterium]